MAQVGLGARTAFNLARRSLARREAFPICDRLVVARGSWASGRSYACIVCTRDIEPLRRGSACFLVSPGCNTPPPHAQQTGEAATIRTAADRKLSSWVRTLVTTMFT